MLGARTPRRDRAQRRPRRGDAGARSGGQRQPRRRRPDRQRSRTAGRPHRRRWPPARGWPGCAPPTRPPSTSWPTSSNPAIAGITDLAGLDQRRTERAGVDPLEPATAALARAKRLGTLRIAARDLLGLDGVEEVGAALSHLAGGLLQRAWDLAAAGGPVPVLPDRDSGDPGDGGLAVIGLGKLGGGELNYSSDVDILLVAPTDNSRPGAIDPRPFLDLARSAWRVDLDLRPEGRAGQLTRTLPSYLAYWDRWAETWEFQALLKARAVAGNRRSAPASRRRPRPGSGAAPSAPTNCARSAGSKPGPSRP